MCVRRQLSTLFILVSLAGHTWAQGSAEKFARVKHLATQLPSLRANVHDRLATTDPGRKEVAVAAIVRLMDTAYLRVGSERYARGEKPSFGASSLRKSHVRVEGDTVHLAFTGKSGVPWARSVTDKELAKAVSASLTQPGDRVFQATERDVRAFLRAFGVKPKDLRTFHANRLYALELERLGDVSPENVKEAISRAAAQLGHTTAVFRRAYLDPSLLPAANSP